MIKLPLIFAGARRWLLMRLIVNGMLQALMVIGSMLLVRHAFNVLLNPEFDDPEIHMFDMGEVWQIALFAAGLLGCTGFSALLRRTERIDAERLGQEYIHHVRLALFGRMKNFAFRSLANRSTGASALRFVGDLSAIRRWVCLGLARIVVSLIVAVLSISVLAYLDLYLAVCSTVILSLGLVWNLGMGPRMRQITTEARRRRGRFAGNINEKIRSFVVIQAFDQYKRERRRFNKQSKRLRDAMVDRARASAGMRVVNEGATALSLAAILSLGALQVFHHVTTSGNVVAAITVVSFLSNAFRNLGRVHEYLQNFRVSKKKILQFMQTKPLRGRSVRLPDLVVKRGAIELRGVGLKTVLNNVSASLSGGCKLALLGDNGAGKSTLLQMIARLVDPTKGKILIDGQNIRRCNIASVRRSIGVVSPDLPLFRGSIRYNLLYRAPDASEAEIARVRELCGIDTLLDQLPKKEYFRLQEGGGNLSLGQRHKLALARALLGNPAILIIDEIDANLDRQTGLILENVIKNFPGTVLMVSRSAFRLALADTFWHIRKGGIETENNYTQWLDDSCQGVEDDRRLATGEDISPQN